MTLRSEFIRTSRLRYHVITQGDDDGLPVLFLHGSFGSSRWWLPVMAYLPDDVLAIAPDMRGCGQSEKTEDGYGIDEQAMDLYQLVIELGWSDFDLVAHSSSGAIAIEYALQHMDTLHTLTLVDTVPIEGVYSPVETLQTLSKMQNDTALLTEALRTLMPSFFPISEEEQDRQAFFDKIVEDANQMAPAAYTEVAQAISGWNRFSDANQLTLPTSILWGEQDQIVEKEAITRTLIAIPGASNLEVLRGVGHSPMIETPLAFTEILVNFITEDYEGFDDVKSDATPLE